MARRPADYLIVHKAADNIEPRVARAFERSVERMRSTVSINELAMALSAGDVKRAERLLTVQAVEDALSPVGTIVRDAVLRGGRIGAEILNKARKR